ncbi:hypothetical protein FSP39_003809 [Pinctada imbricata]|uniref:Uncharacterized protein n=1 Tax=Pinctada imbricata TaxID=66713 RepID=A0AA88XCI9_PINIB|nr:hypothetical protein FSP39_003809 [Pinctada imbricata]
MGISKAAFYGVIINKLKLRSNKERHNTASVLISRTLNDDIQRTLQKVKSRRKRGWWGKVGHVFSSVWHKTIHFIEEHEHEIAEGIEIAVEILHALHGKREALNASKILEKEIHHMNPEKLKVDAHIANITTFLDNEIHFLREHLSVNPHAVGVPNKYTGSLTSAN